MRFLLLLISFVLMPAIYTVAQPSFSLNVGMVVTAGGDDPYRLQNSWVPASSSSSGDNAIVFYEGGTGTVIKLSAMWDFSEIFSAGLAYRIIGWNLGHNHRSSDIRSLGGQFRINFSQNSNKVIPFFQGVFYFNNNTTLTQNQATSGLQTQPAFSLSQSTSIGFDADLGVEFKLGKAWGLQVTGGYGGTMATQDGFTFNPDYGAAYLGPKGIDGVFNYAFSAGIKYYPGRGSKKRDF